MRCVWQLSGSRIKRDAGKARSNMRRLACVLAFAAGFLSLCLEIVWIRFAGFVEHGVPVAFSLVLAFYILGIALGASVGKQLCREGSPLVYRAGMILMVTGVLDALLPWAAVVGFEVKNAIGELVMCFAMFMTAFGKSLLFPLVHQLGSAAKSSEAGRAISHVYSSNILGSMAGPLICGFVLMDFLTMQQLFTWLSIAGFLLGLACVWPSRRGLVGIAMVVAAALGLPQVWQSTSMIERLIAVGQQKSRDPVVMVVENRYGIIHVQRDHNNEDSIYGGNVYDGMATTDFVRDSNGISRLFALNCVQPQARRILVIGMSGGAWVRTLASFPNMEMMDVVEINPGYLKVLERYPQLSEFQSDPRIRVQLDDGRRWLRRNPDRRYDLIVMNTTYYWRANASLLLSQDFLRILKGHLREGGVLAYNSTGSTHVFATAERVLNDVYRYANFVVAGEPLGVG